jgi:Putative MetA-pathway of phenol degradation
MQGECSYGYTERGSRRRRELAESFEKLICYNLRVWKVTLSSVTPKNRSARRKLRLSLMLSFLLCLGGRLCAQLPFYTDDTGVTERGKWHFEFFDEYDALQLQYPNLKQNTANYKLNYGLPHDLEIDVDSPYLSIFRTTGNQSSIGVGDTNLGIKAGLHKEASTTKLPAFAVSFYVEFPTGNVSQQLGSGLSDYWLNFIAQKSLSPKTRLIGNLGYLFAGNTSTGALGTQTTRGHVIPGGLSLLHDFRPTLTLGAEIFGAYAENGNLGRSQIQAMVGGQYAIRKGLSLCFGAIGGKYIASPRLGGQLGFSLDLPDLFQVAR